jgi:N-acetyl-1-D-myo-inositol-2-amino-2-deoxy-alpha-D-glucopyranoside deacetylase
MRAHATQIAVDAPFFALSNQIRHEASGVECYTLLAGPRAPGAPDGPAGPAGPGGRETDLFAQ